MTTMMQGKCVESRLAMSKYLKFLQVQVVRKKVRFVKIKIKATTINGDWSKQLVKRISLDVLLIKKFKLNK